MFTITHHGVPIGLIESLPAEERITIGVQPLPGYAPLQELVRAASRALADTALSRPTPASAPVASALRRGAELGRELELRDEAGALVPADYIELTDWPGGEPEIAALIRLRDAHAGAPARVPPRTSGGADAHSPAA
jgi:hypothetical protein